MATIVVVDDSWITRRGIMGILEKEGHEIIEADNGRNGVKAVLDCAPECVVMDLLMPELDGYGALQALKDKNISTPVIVMTADIQETVRQKVMAMGAFAFLNKPPNVDELIKVVNKAVGS